MKNAMRVNEKYNYGEHNQRIYEIYNQKIYERCNQRVYERHNQEVYMIQKMYSAFSG